MHLITPAFQETLTWECTCKDGTTPDLVEYADTVQAFVNDIRLADCGEQAGSDIKKMQDCYLTVVMNWPGIIGGDDSSTESSATVPQSSSPTASNGPSSTSESSETGTTSTGESTETETASVAQSSSQTVAPQASETSQPGSSVKTNVNMLGVAMVCSIGLLGGLIL